MKITLYALLLLAWLNTHAQKNEVKDSLQNSDEVFYREDQFYAGVGFNLLTNLDQNVKQSGFSGGFDLGIIRDFPINKKSTLAIGIGLGININTYNQNIFIGEQEDGRDIISPISDDSNLSANRFSTHTVEIPIQFRWRNSTPSRYDFWRIYGGAKIGYLYYFKSTYKAAGTSVVQTNVSALNRLRTSAFLSFGYNLVNIQIQYDLFPLFEGDFTSSDNKIGVNPLRLGFVFYLL